ncbi:hypothetical protein LSAT2_033041 [Lamellibrachia satsuma]|nr:hypothetical protein LSAT2_033041 [Lamellibrachia satsuma]
MVVGCRWCVQNANGVELSHPFCGEYDKCYHGRINFPSPYPIAGGPKIGLILFFTILVASAIVVPFGYVVFRYKISHYEKRLTIDDHSAEPDM